MNKLPFTKKNYWIMLVGILVVTLGFGLMASSSHHHGFDFIGITLSPIIVIIGFVIVLFSVLHHPEKKSSKKS